MTGIPARTEAGEPATRDTAQSADPVAGTAQDDAASLDDGRLLRALADLDNLRKRFQREVAREREAERFRVAAEWLPVVDDLDRAFEHLSDADAQQGSFPEGVRAVRDNAIRILARLGYPRFGSIGDRFDPERYEVVGAVEADAEPGTVVAVVRPGYGTPEVILRPAAVVVAKGGA
jgi:molecular chaperone GrpE